MKNQYVGDIGDYGKYGLLRFLSGKGIKIGINWYLTENDGTNDGKFTDYLTKKDDRLYDDKLFDLLIPIVNKGKKKSVIDVEKRQIIPKAVFFNELLNTTDLNERNAWHERAKEKLINGNTELVFADPDNGTLADYKKAGHRNGAKYAALEELLDYYNEGKDVVYYCHKARRKEKDWQNKKREFLDMKSDAKIVVLTFHRGTQRSYIFATHPENYEKYDKIINEFLSGPWGSVSSGNKRIPFTREKIE